MIGECAVAIEIGKEMEWHRIVSNYGHISIYRVTIEKVGKRITIKVPLKNGATCRKIVRPHNLRDIAAVAGDQGK